MKTPMMTLGALAALWLAAGAAAGQDINPASDLGQFRDFRSAAMEAMDRGELGVARDNLSKAADILPDSPSLLLLQAQVAIKQRRNADAKAALRDYLNRGYVLDLARNPDFNAVWDSGLEDQLQGNESPVGDMHAAATLPDFVIAEGIASNPETGEIFVSGIHDGKVMALSGSGAREVVGFRPGVAAYGLGYRDGKLWAVTAASRQTKGYDPKANLPSKIVVFDPNTGAIASAVADNKARNFTHLLMGRDDLYVTDAERGEVLRIQGYGKKLETLVPEGYMDSPGGMAENDDASVLIVADFISGLYRVDLKAGQMVRLLPPANAGLMGIASLARDGDDLIAVQNGFQPNRILRLHMSHDWTKIESTQTLLLSPKVLSQPTQGVVADGHFIFVANSQWANLDDLGNPKSDSPDPAVIGTIDLGQ